MGDHVEAQFEHFGPQQKWYLGVIFSVNADADGTCDVVFLDGDFGPRTSAACIRGAKFTNGERRLLASSAYVDAHAQARGEAAAAPPSAPLALGGPSRLDSPVPPRHTGTGGGTGGGCKRKCSAVDLTRWQSLTAGERLQQLATVTVDAAAFFARFGEGTLETDPALIEQRHAVVAQVALLHLCGHSLGCLPSGLSANRLESLNPAWDRNVAESRAYVSDPSLRRSDCEKSVSELKASNWAKMNVQSRVQPGPCLHQLLEEVDVAVDRLSRNDVRRAPRRAAQLRRASPLLHAGFHNQRAFAATRC